MKTKIKTILTIIAVIALALLYNYHKDQTITKPQRKALKKQEQDKNKERIKALKELKRGYRRPERLAKDLGITDIVLTSLLGGQEMINDELWEKIQDLRGEY